MPSELERSKFQIFDISSILCDECILLIFLSKFLYNPPTKKNVMQSRRAMKRLRKAELKTLEMFFL